MNNDFTTEELETLIKQAKTGDKAAFEVLYTKLYSPLFRFVKYRTRDHEKSLDICQDVFVRWYKSLDSYEIKMKPLSYLMMIAMRLIINDSRKASAVMMPEDAEEYIGDDSIESFDVTYDFKLDFENIKNLFEFLSENQKNVLTMRYVADADTETIAQALELTITNVRKIESRAIAKLKELCQNKQN